MYFTVVVCSLAAAVQCVLRNHRHSHLDTDLLISYRGWDQTGSNGANLSFPQALGIDNTPGSPNAQRNDWIVGLINSGYVLIRRSCRHRPQLPYSYFDSPYIASCLLGCWLTDPLNYFFGRRGTLFFCGIFCTLSVIGQGLAQTWPQLLVGHDLLSYLGCTHLLLGLSLAPWFGDGSKSIDIPCFCRRKRPSKYSWGSCHVLADVGK